MNGSSLCMFKAAGIEVCPGCGLAHSMQSALRFHLSTSVSQHWFGIPAVLILIFRVYALTFLKPKPNAKQKLHDPGSFD